MYPKAVEGKYLLNRKPNEAFSLVQQALAEIGLKELKVKKSIPPSFLIMEYKAGWGNRREIEFVIKGRENGSEVSIKWFYLGTSQLLEAMPHNERQMQMMRAIEKRRREPVERLFEELKHRIGASDIPTIEPEKTLKEKEIIKEKEVIVKIRCPYCHNLYDETLNECPHCGAER
jgi:hypothetical protein